MKLIIAEKRSVGEAIASAIGVKEKKKGVKCIGCPYAGTCQKHQQGQDCR